MKRPRRNTLTEGRLGLFMVDTWIEEPEPGLSSLLAGPSVMYRLIQSAFRMPVRRSRLSRLYGDCSVHLEVWPETPILPKPSFS